MLRTSRLVLRRWRDEDRVPFAALNADPEVMRYFPRTLTRAESDMMIDRIEAGFDEHGYGLWAVDVVQPSPGRAGDAGGLAGGFADDDSSAGGFSVGGFSVGGFSAGGFSAGGFIGFVGLAWQRFPAHFTPALEIGWRLARHAWGRGYATEAAVAARDFAFRPAAAQAAARTARTGAADTGAADTGAADTGPADTGPADTGAAAGAEISGAGMDEIVSMTTRTNTPSQAVMRRIGMTRDPADDFRHPNLAPDHPLVEHVLYRLRRPAGS